jgi:hypothetical protein
MQTSAYSINHGSTESSDVRTRLPALHVHVHVCAVEVDDCCDTCEHTVRCCSRMSSQNAWWADQNAELAAGIASICGAWLNQTSTVWHYLGICMPMLPPRSVQTEIGVASTKHRRKQQHVLRRECRKSRPRKRLLTTQKEST